MKTNILSIFLFILTVSSTKGQVQELLSINKTYSVNVRFGQNQIKEMILFPMVHKGMVTELSFETEKVKNSLQQFQLVFTYSRVKTSLEEMPKSGNIRIGIDYSYNFLIFQRNNIRYYLGPKMSLCYSFMLFPNWDDSHAYWADYLSIGPNNLLSVALKHQSEWFTSLNFALVSIVSRPEESRPFKMDNSSMGGILRALNSNIEPGLMNKVLQINFKTEYRFPVFVTKREAVTFNSDIIRISGNGEQPVFQIINRFGIKIML